MTKLKNPDFGRQTTLRELRGEFEALIIEVDKMRDDIRKVLEKAAKSI